MTSVMPTRPPIWHGLYPCHATHVTDRPSKYTERIGLSFFCRTFVFFVARISLVPILFCWHTRWTSSRIRSTSRNFTFEVTSMLLSRASLAFPLSASSLRPRRSRILPRPHTPPPIRKAHPLTRPTPANQLLRATKRLRRRTTKSLTASRVSTRPAPLKSRRLSFASTT